ncbi:hypothetical protein [Microbulbifer magnicolonia]|uniref:hypothetical protein n=1 Tax=Microbulbifer magnicolonia TaxID=3109744 RepID=UPI002B40689B|nr:hypothetical protein [Microbulbifer sp. GG15]
MKPILLTIIALLISSCSTSEHVVEDSIVEKFQLQSNQALLLVRVVESQYTGKYPYECSEDECVPFYFWFVYEAEVLKVIKGNFVSRHINFAALHHTNYSKDVTNEWYVQVAEFEDRQTSHDLGVEYYVVAHDARAFY